jgi:hypothetical protein
LRNYIPVHWKILKEMDKFLGTYEPSKTDLRGYKPPNRSLTYNEIEAAIESPKKEKSRT